MGLFFFTKTTETTENIVQDSITQLHAETSADLVYNFRRAFLCSHVVKGLHDLSSCPSSLSNPNTFRRIDREKWCCLTTLFCCMKKSTFLRTRAQQSYANRRRGWDTAEGVYHLHAICEPARSLKESTKFIQRYCLTSTAR